MKEQIGYLVLEQGWEYNDEYYYRSETEGGMPHGVYLDKAAAQKECDRRNFNEFFTVQDYYRAKDFKGRGLIGEHQCSLISAMEYDYDEKDKFWDGIQAIIEKDPTIFEGSPTEPPTDYPDNCEFNWKLTRPLTEDEIQTFMRESSIGSNYIEKVVIK